MTAQHDPIYLDYNATTPHDPEVIEAMRPFLEREFGNPSSAHRYGKVTREAVERARAHVASLIDTAPGNIVFTSGGTESDNWALVGTAQAMEHRGRHIVTSRIEHPAVLETCAALEAEGFEVTRLEVDEYGLVRLEELERAVRDDTILVSIMHANNEIGTVEPVAEIARIARNRGALVHTDAAQSLGKIPVSVDELGVDLLTVAGHKLYAPKGIGALFIRDGVQLPPLFYGGGQERGLRPGTENVLEIVGLGEACRIAERDLERNAATMRTSRDLLYKRLAAACEVRLNGHPERRLPNTLSVSFHGIDASPLLAEISEVVTASAGSACHADSVEPSAVIRALGVPLEWARGTVRFSTGKFTTREEVERAAEAVVTAYGRLAGKRA